MYPSLIFYWIFSFFDINVVILKSKNPLKENSNQGKFI